MPRLTNSEYYRRHRFLNYIWQHHQGLFAQLTKDQQYALHNFYRPDWYSVTKDQLVTYRRDIQQTEPGLSAKASRAYLRLEQSYRLIQRDDKKKAQRQSASPKYRKLERVSVKAVVRPEPDWDRFAYALLRHVKDQMGQEKPESEK